MRLQTKIIFYFLLVGVIPLAIIGGYFLLRVDEQIRTSSHDALGAIGAEVCREIQRTLNEAYSSIHLLAENPIILDSSSTREEIEDELSKTNRFYPIIKDVSLVSGEGLTIASARYAFRGEWKASSWFQRGLNGESLISEVHALIYPYRIVMTVVVPIIDNGNVRDVMIGHIDMNPIQNIIKGVSYGAGSELFIVDSRGILVASTAEESMLLRPLDIPELNSALEDNTYTPVSYFSDHFRVAVILPVGAFGSEPVHTGWNLVLTMPEREAYHVALSIKRGLLYAVLFSLGTVAVLSVLLGQPIVKRTSMLAKRAASLGSGQFQVINNPGNDEIGEIAQAFNFASRQLYESEQKIKDYQQNLEYLVIKRTKELDDSNKALREEIRERKLVESARNLLEEQLMHSQKMEAVGKLAGGIAHDFNNLLQAISGYAQLLLKDKASDHKDHSRLMAIEKSADRAGQLVQKLLLFSRKAPVQTISLDINQELEHCATLLERVVPKMVQIKLNLQKNLKPVAADPVQVEQVILNLGVNASDAMPDGGDIRIETSSFFLGSQADPRYPGLEPGEYVVLTVSDNGQGMDKATMSRIFEPFFTTKIAGKGTGLGLSSVYGIVLGHKGQIFCDSEPGKGTRFIIFWPTAKAVPVKNQKDESEEILVSTGGGRILVVDDEPEIVALTREALEDFGYTVLSAADGEEGLEIYREQGQFIDLVLLDLNMPGMGGHKCLQELLKIDASVKVVITSGYSANGQVRDTLSAGARGFVGKPYQLKELAETVRKVLCMKGE